MFELKDYWIITIEAIQNIDIIEELNIDYGSENIFCNQKLIELRELQYPRYNDLLDKHQSF